MKNFAKIFAMGIVFVASTGAFATGQNTSSDDCASATNLSAKQDDHKDVGAAKTETKSSTGSADGSAKQP